MILFKFEDTAVTAVALSNEDGSFNFTKEGGYSSGYSSASPSSARYETLAVLPPTTPSGFQGGLVGPTRELLSTTR